MTTRLTAPTLKNAALFATVEAAERAREAYIATARIAYGPRVWLTRNIQQPVYVGSQGGWVLPVEIFKTGRTVYVSEAV